MLGCQKARLLIISQNKSPRNNCQKNENPAVDVVQYLHAADWKCFAESDRSLLPLALLRTMRLSDLKLIHNCPTFDMGMQILFPIRYAEPATPCIVSQYCISDVIDFIGI